MAALYFSLSEEHFTNGNTPSFNSACNSPVSTFGNDYNKILFSTFADHMQNKLAENDNSDDEKDKEVTREKEMITGQSGNEQEGGETGDAEETVDEGAPKVTMDEITANECTDIDNSDADNSENLKGNDDNEGIRNDDNDVTKMTCLDKCRILKEIYDKYRYPGTKPKMARDREGTKKKKKWKRVGNEEFGFKESLFPRPVSDNFKIDIDHEKLFNQIEAECDKLEDITDPFAKELEMEGNSLNRDGRYLRADRDRKITKAHKQVKSKHCESVRNNNGRKTLYIHHRLYKIISMEIQRLCYMPSKTKQKNELKREEMKKPAAARPYYNPSPRAPVQSLAHALDNNNAPTTFESDLINVLISLQHRDLTPEDYEMLLRLDESVAPKTISEDKIAQFKTDTVDEKCAGDLCAICMEPYEVGQTRKFLPCNHVFHDNCITMWLSNSSLNCPIDNLPVDT